MTLVCTVYRSIADGTVLIKRSRGQRTSQNITISQWHVQFIYKLQRQKLALNTANYWYGFSHNFVYDTCDGVMGEGLYIGQVVVRTVFLKPLADILLSPQHHRFGQTGQSRTGVIHREGFSRTQLKETWSRNLYRCTVACVGPMLATSVTVGVFVHFC